MLVPVDLRYLTDDDLTLRAPVEEDASSIASLVQESLAELRPWLPWAVEGFDAGNARDLLYRDVDRQGDPTYNFVMQRSGVIVGACSIHMRAGNLAEIGYWTGTRHTGKGIATAATRMLARLAYEHVGAKRVLIRTDSDNLASRRVALKGGGRRQTPPLLPLDEHVHPDGTAHALVEFVIDFYHMRDESEEQVLLGGNMSSVVRIDDTVRREQKFSSDAVHDLLLHLESVGFDGAPRFLGIDRADREILSFIPGEVGCAPYPLPAYMWNGDSLIRAGKLLRQFHEAVRSFVPPEDATWTYSRGIPSASQLVCHNDIAPYNTVFMQERPIAFIDWDLAGPSDPIMDIAHAIIYYLPVARESDAQDAGVPEPSQWHGRLRAFCDAYGLNDRSRILDAKIERQLATIDGFKRHAAEEDARFQRLIAEGHLVAHQRMLEWLQDHVGELAMELT